MSAAVTVRVASDLDELSRYAASFFLNRYAAARIAGRQFTVALSGGSTPRLLYTLLGQSPFVGQIEWARVHLFWGDERCVPKVDAESNFRLVAETLLAGAPVPVENVHAVPVELGEPQAVAAAYEAHLRDFFRLGPGEFPAFDLSLLGLGADGHTASLFPGSPALKERQRLVISVYAEALKSYRITLALPVLNHARTVAFLVAGADKAVSLRATLAGDAGLPAAHVRPERGELRWYVDESALGRSA